MNEAQEIAETLRAEWQRSKPGPRSIGPVMEYARGFVRWKMPEESETMRDAVAWNLVHEPDIT